MSKFSLRVLTALLLSCIAFHSFSQPKVKLVYAADLPIIGSTLHGDYAELATLLETMRSEPSSQTLFVFGGASLAPSPLASFDSGSHIVDILNQLEPDVMSITKREFSYFEDELILRSYEASFPFLLSNAIDLQTAEPLDGIHTDLIIEAQGTTVGFISIVEPGITTQYLLRRLSIDDPKKAVNSLASKLRRQGADLVVLLHSDQYSFIQPYLEDGTLDLAIQSETNDARLPLTANNRHPNQVIVDKPGNAAVIEVTKSGDSLAKSTVEMIALDSLPEHPDINSVVSTYQQRLENQFGRTIAKVIKPFSTTREAVRTGESGFGNVIADAMRVEGEADLAIFNGGTIRGDTTYEAGQVFTKRDLLLELPFRSRLVTLEVSGDLILQALENGVSEYELIQGRFPQVSSVTMQVNTQKAPGQRVSDVFINEQALQKNQTYLLATTDYLFNGGDDYVMLRNAKRRYDLAPTTPLLSDVLQRALTRTGELNAKSENRIRLD